MAESLLAGLVCFIVLVGRNFVSDNCKLKTLKKTKNLQTYKPNNLKIVKNLGFPALVMLGLG